MGGGTEEAKETVKFAIYNSQSDGHDAFTL